MINDLVIMGLLKDYHANIWIKNKIVFLDIFSILTNDVHRGGFYRSLSIFGLILFALQIFSVCRDILLY